MRPVPSAWVLLFGVIVGSAGVAWLLYASWGFLAARLLVAVFAWIGFMVTAMVAISLCRLALSRVSERAPISFPNTSVR